MGSEFDWDRILKLIEDIIILDGDTLTIEFKSEIYEISKRLDLVSDCLGIAYMMSPDGDKGHYTVAGLKRVCVGRKVAIILPYSTDFPGFLGIRIYHVDGQTLSRRFFLGKDLIRLLPGSKA